MRSPVLLVPVVLLGTALLAGCLPSDQRSHSRELFPADSLSRQVAEAAPVDTLSVIWRVEAPRAVRYPLTVLWAGDRIVMADAQRGALHSFSEGGDYLGAFEDDALQYPFLAGARGDTVAVLSRGRAQLHLVVLAADGTGRIARSLPIPEGRNAVAAWPEAGLFVKTTGEDGAQLTRLEGGETYELPAAPWRHIGFLRAWGDTLVSLSGYRPVVDLLSTEAPPGTRADTLSLVGFDSPQLARSRRFALGEINEPPLLTPSGDPVGPYLFVLNARAGWVQLDAFAREGGALRLRRSLLSPDPEVSTNYFAADVAARQVGGGYEFVVLETRPQPALARYRWTPRQD